MNEKKREWFRQDIRFTFDTFGWGSKERILREKGAESYQPEQELIIYEKNHSEEMLTRAKKAKINLIMFAGFIGFGIEAEKAEIQKAAEFANLCHKEGIKVGIYVQGGSLMYETFFKEYPQAKNWVQLNCYGQPIIYGNAYYRYLPCYNQKGFIKFIKEVIKISVEYIQADLLHFDNMFWAYNACYCPACEKGFRSFLKSKYKDPDEAWKRFGFTEFDHVKFPFPPVDMRHYQWMDREKGLGDGILHDAILQEWGLFKMKSLCDTYQIFVEYARSLNPETAVICNPPGIGGRGQNLWLNDGVDAPSLIKIGDGAWAEDGNNPGLNKNGILVSRIRNFKQGRILQRTIFAYQHNANIEETKIFLAETLAFNQQTLGMYCSPLSLMGADNNLHSLSEELKYAEFHSKYKNYLQNTSTISNVAVYHSPTTLMYNWRETILPLLLFEQTLIQTKIPFDIIFEPELKFLDKYKVLVLCNVECLTDREAKQILTFVKRGGGLVITDKTSCYNQYRRKRLSPALYPFQKIQKGCKENNCICPELKLTKIRKFHFGKGRIIYVPKIKESIPVTEPLPTDISATCISHKYWKLPLNWKTLSNAIKWAAKNSQLINIKGPLTIVMELLRQKERLIIHLIDYDPKRKKIKIEVTIDSSLISKKSKIVVLSPEDKINELKYQIRQNKLYFSVYLKRYCMIIIEPST